MFIGFLGAPNSGKTTIAAKVFAELKQSGQPDVEFIAEEARKYIAFKRIGGDFSPLTDEDQKRIFEAQSNIELTMNQVVGESGVVISDSCAVNSLWYMSPQAVTDIVKSNHYYFGWLRQNALLFHCSILGIMTQEDKLRVHTPSQARTIENDILAFLVTRKERPFQVDERLRYLPIVSPSLAGPLNLKVNRVVETIFERLTR